MADPPQSSSLGSLLSSYLRTQKLTEAQKRDIASILQAKLGSRNCEMCSRLSWAIGDNVVQPVPLTINHIARNYGADASTAYPSIHLVCTNCGNSKLFLLTQLGYDPFAPEKAK